jgi:ribosomal protein S18 acetylase RimI-like enzyme
MPELVIKLARPQDADKLKKLMQEAVQFKLARGDNSWASVPYTTEKLKQRIKSGGIYVAWIGNMIVGTVRLTEDDEFIWGKQPPTAAYIHQLAIKDGYHGQHLGRVLLDWLSKQAAQKGYDQLRLDVPSDNNGLKHYYEKQGFVWVKDKEVRAPWGIYASSLYERSIKPLDEASPSNS